MRSKELKRGGISFVALLAVYLVYATLVVPIIEPPAPERSSNGLQVGAPTASATDRYQADLAGLFPEGAWENESPKILRNRNTLLLFKDYKPQDDGTLHVFPCTAVVLGDRSTDESRRASSLILQAPEGAILQLSRPIDMGSTQLGQPVAGFLLGKIRIHSRGHADGTGRLNILTSDVQIRPEMILAPHDVEFQYEQSHASGRDLMIKLMPLKSNRQIDRARGWAGVRSIELVHLNQLHMEISNPSTGDRDESDQSRESDKAIPVDIVCQGPLRVDFVENLVTLEENVDLRRRMPDGVVDTLRCQKLSLHLKQTKTPSADEDSPSSGSPSSGSSTTQLATTQLATTESSNSEIVQQRPVKSSRDDRFGSLPKLEVGKVVAEGDPVVLDAPSRSVHVRSRKLTYDLQHGRFQLDAAPDDPSDQIHFRYEQQNIIARQLDCLLDSPGVKRVRIAGPGRFVGQLTGSDPQPVRADWEAELVFEREGELHRLTLDQAAEVRIGDTYAVQAEAIHVWLEPAPRALGDGSSQRPDSPIEMSLRPRRIVATAHPDHPNARPVRLSSEGTIATTQRLDAQFQHVAARPEQAKALPPTVRMASSNRPPRAPAGGHASTRERPSRETRVFGRSLSVVFRVAGRDVTVDTLVLQDDVRVQQFSLREPNRPLFDLRADTVRMQDPSANQMHTLSARGQPVMIQSDQMRMQTTELNLDQARNLVWTQRPGKMTLMVDRGANGQRLAPPQEMTINWYRTLEFDGLTARFDGGVDVRSSDQRMRGQAMDVQLTRKLNFGQSSSSDSIDIQQIDVKGNVLIETAEYVEQQLATVAYLQVPFARIDRQTGDLQAGGPGRLTTVRSGFRGNFGPAAGSRSTPPQPVDSEVKTFLQVDYQREITGNIYRKAVDFSDRVQVTYGPVLSWNETLSFDAPLRKNDVLLSCDRLTVAQSTLSTAGQSMLDMLAQGNTYVEGQSFTARGNRVSYEQSKELLVLEGTGRTDAVLSHQLRIGSPRSETAARKILYWTRSGRVEVDDARYLDLSNLGS